MPPMKNNLNDYKHKTVSVSEWEKLNRDLETMQTALKLIQHATAPTHDDGAYHENAFTLASDALSEVEQ